MRWSAPFLLLFATILHAQDLASLDRKITKEPAYRHMPEYGLLVFGPQLEKKLWMVRDGDTLYIDRSGTGDLTVPDAKVTANLKASAPTEFEYLFEIGKLPGCPGEPSDVQLSTRRLSSLPELNEAMKKIVSKNPDAVIYMLYMQTTHPAWKGNGISGRLVHMVGPIDHRGALAFGATAAEAPIIHIGGPLQIVPYGDLPRVRPGGTHEICTSLGTPGHGSGTTAFLGYEKTVPPEVKPSLAITWPQGEKQTTSLQAKYVLQERCCTINFYGKLQIPTDIGAGKAQLVISMDDWKAGQVAPSQASMEVLAKANPVIPQTVTLPPVRTFAHQDRQGLLHQLQLSPDGTKLFASSYPGGVVQWWDVATAKQLHSIETGRGLRGTASYAMLTPDWKHVWVGEEKRPKVEELEIDGKKHIKWMFDARLRGWNAATGEAMDPIVPIDGRSFRLTRLSPDGRYLIAREEVSGTFPREQGRVQKISLYDMQTRQKLPFFDKLANFSEFTRDSKYIYIQELKPAPDFGLVAYHLVSVPDGKIIRSLAADYQKNTGLLHHSVDHRLVYLFVTKYATPNNYQKYSSEVQCWNMETGKKEHTLSIGDESDYRRVYFSDKHPWLITLDVPNPRKPSDKPGTMFIHSLADLKLHKSVLLPGQASVSGSAFHPQRDIVVQVCQTFPKEAYANREFAFNEAEIEQPRLVWIDIPSGKILRTDTLPPSFPTKLMFTPDGKQLLMTVKGSVLLFDVPGEIVR